MARTFRLTYWMLLWIATGTALAASPALSDDRAAWGGVVWVGTEDSTLLLEAGRTMHLVVVDPTGAIRDAKGGGPLTLTDIQPGDRVDYAWSPWAGLAIADVLHVTSRRQLGEGRPEAPRPASRPTDQPTAGGMTFLK